MVNAIKIDVVELDTCTVKYVLSESRAEIAHVINRKGNVPQKVVLPTSIDGRPVEVIQRGAFCAFECEELFLPDGVSLKPKAFENSKVKKVHMPGVFCIPASCFNNSAIEELLDVDDIDDVHCYAFKDTYQLKSLCWFKNAKRIPECCFENSSLESITGTNSVDIEENAFLGCKRLNANLDSAASCV